MWPRTKLGFRMMRCQRLSSDAEVVEYEETQATKEAEEPVSPSVDEIKVSPTEGLKGGFRRFSRIG